MKAPAFSVCPLPDARGAPVLRSDQLPRQCGKQGPRLGPMHRLRHLARRCQCTFCCSLVADNGIASYRLSYRLTSDLQVPKSDRLFETDYTTWDTSRNRNLREDTFQVSSSAVCTWQPREVLLRPGRQHRPHQRQPHEVGLCVLPVRLLLHAEPGVLQRRQGTLAMGLIVSVSLAEPAKLMAFKQSSYLTESQAARLSPNSGS